MPRATFSGSLTFGPLAIPIKLYTAQDDKGITLKLVHRDCGGLMSQVRRCKECEEEVEWTDLDRGYQLSKDQMIIFTQEEIDSIPLESTKAVGLKGFLTEESAPDPIYWGSSYFMAPDRGGDKPFSLITRAMRTEGLVGLASISLRNKERNALIRPIDDGRVLLTLLFWGNEVRDDPAYYTSEVDARTEREEALTHQLVSGMILDSFDPNSTSDAYKNAIEKMIEVKLEGGVINTLQAHAPPTSSMEDALEAAVAAMK